MQLSTLHRVEIGRKVLSSIPAKGFPPGLQGGAKSLREAGTDRRPCTFLPAWNARGRGVLKVVMGSQETLLLPTLPARFHILRCYCVVSPSGRSTVPVLLVHFLYGICSPTIR